MEIKQPLPMIYGKIKKHYENQGWKLKTSYPDFQKRVKLNYSTVLVFTKVNDQKQVFSYGYYTKEMLNSNNFLEQCLFNFQIQQISVNVRINNPAHQVLLNTAPEMFIWDDDKNDFPDLV